LQPAPDSVLTLQNAEDSLVFTLNGLSKTVGLPQMKLAWMIVNGPPGEVSETLARLELIADTYLSAGTPVQCALESLLRLRSSIQGQILARLRGNLDFLHSSGLRVLDVEAGWYAIIASADEDSVIPLLRDHDVLVQPGFFYDFERSGYLVLSLLTPPDVFREGVRRIVQP
jgi:aspartate/methionine/tyrosine aminotransferase